MTDLNQSDHDLLVELRTEMRGMRTDVKDLRDNTSSRVAALETEKMNKEESYRLKAEADKQHDEMWAAINWLRGIAYTAIGILAALQIYLTFIK